MRLSDSTMLSYPQTRTYLPIDSLFSVIQNPGSDSLVVESRRLAILSNLISIRSGARWTGECCPKHPHYSRFSNGFGSLRFLPPNVVKPDLFLWNISFLLRSAGKNPYCDHVIVDLMEQKNITCCSSLDGDLRFWSTTSIIVLSRGQSAADRQDLHTAGNKYHQEVRGGICGVT